MRAHHVMQQRKDIEGSMFVVKRNCQPYFQLIVKNRLSTIDMVQDITTEFQMQAMDPYLIFRSRESPQSDVKVIHGIWFYDQDGRERTNQMIPRIVELAGTLQQQQLLQQQQKQQQKQFQQQKKLAQQQAQKEAAAAAAATAATTAAATPAFLSPSAVENAGGAVPNVAASAALMASLGIGGPGGASSAAPPAAPAAVEPVNAAGQNLMQLLSPGTMGTPGSTAADDAASKIALQRALVKLLTTDQAFLDTIHTEYAAQMQMLGGVR